MVGRAEWLAGQLSVSDIARTYGPLRQTITTKAKRMKWGKRGSLVDLVHKEIESQLLEERVLRLVLHPWRPPRLSSSQPSEELSL